MNPKYPIFIVSKGRWESRLTSRHLTRMKVPHFIVVEESEAEEYRKVVDPAYTQILILPEHYFDAYDVFDNLGRTKSTGPGPARNYAWDVSIEMGFDYHWVMDDNIDGFYRLNRNLKLPVADGTIFRCMEDFIERYENAAMGGPNYFMFASRKTTMPPYVLNTRIYSCNFIKNDVPYRWRGRYNEDTDISLRMLKDGLCTVQFNAFLQYKIRTQTIGGGNTQEFYKHEGTLPKSQMLVDMHPDVSRLVWKFKRWHHHVDYSHFMKNNKLIRKKGIVIPTGTNNYGMKLIYVDNQSECLL